jgi:polysaccharide deacetylase 2 family uncharacterized protein YibQ
MANPLEKLSPLFAKLKELVPRLKMPQPFQTQVDLRIFAPVFGASMVLLGLLVLLIPSYIPKVSKGIELPKWASARVTITEDKSTAKSAPNAPVAKRKLTEAEEQAIEANDRLTHDALLPAPVEALEEGPRRQRVPRVAEDGRRPWFVYSRPFNRVDPRPRIAIAVADLGLNRLTTDSAINGLPGAITLIFTAGDSSEAWMNRARNSGHEVLLSVPMEPFDYPANDPGPGTLLSNNLPEENMKRLRDAMAQGKGYVGLTTLTGSRFTSSPEQLRPIMEDVYSRGLLWFDGRLVPLSSAHAVSAAMKVPAVHTDFRVTTDKSRAAADLLFQDAETSARHSGASTVLVYASPMTIQAVKEWVRTLPDRGFALAPISAMVQ